MVHELPDGAAFGALCDRCLVPAQRLPRPRSDAEAKLVALGWVRAEPLSWHCPRCARRSATRRARRAAASRSVAYGSARLMLADAGAGSFVATCDVCGCASTPIAGNRELAITRLMLERWHLRTSEGRTRAVCAACRPSTLPFLAAKPRPSRS